MLSKVKIDNQSLLSLSMTVSYRDDQGEYSDTMYFDKFNVWRDADLLPQVIQRQLTGQTSGYSERFSFDEGELVLPQNRSLVYSIRNADFNRHGMKSVTTEPHSGRFYPAGWFQGIRDNYSDNRFPVRAASVSEETIEVDFNHPLAGCGLELEFAVHSVSAHGEEHGGRCNDCIADLLTGPGMQMPYQGQATDFLTDDPYQRADESADSAFYALPRMLEHLDTSAIQQLKMLYTKLIPENACVLDLMGSLNSHLPDSINPHYVSGLGMNQQELEANPVLDDCTVHDLNNDPVLPYAPDSFDVVLCNVSVEYLINPLHVFADVYRVLKPGGQFIVTFSNRWFPGKAIQLWTNLHEFERMGLVSEYFRRSAAFENIHTHSVRGLPRPENDRHKMPFSDPLYAVWAAKPDKAL